MDYDLVLNLKNAGFPQKYGEMFRWCTPQGSLAVVLDPEKYRDCAYMPTLSELISACGEQFTSLELGGYKALGQKLWLWTATGEGGESKGATPEIAVANLWLALNKPLTPTT